MAKYDVTYSCGHAGVVTLFGKSSQREWALEREAGKLCPDCYREELESRREEENKKAAEANRTEELPELIGTPKQIAWGETCRFNLLNRAQKAIENYEKKVHEGKEELFREITNAGLQKIAQETSAHWWIENREMKEYEIINMFTKIYENTKNEPIKRIEDENQKEIKAEITIRPEVPVTETVAEIKFKDDEIQVYFPERRDDFWKLIKKKLGFTWDRKASYWARMITKTSGTPSDRAAETGHRLLANNFIVRIGDQETREKAVTGAFEPEHTRWIFARVEGDYQGWFVIQWNHEREDYYRVARNITRSKWSKPGVVVPPEIYEEVLDFAERYDFRFSDGAKRILQKVQYVKEASLTVNIEDNTPEKFIASNETPDLEIHEEVSIDESLRDDN